MLITEHGKERFKLFFRCGRKLKNGPFRLHNLAAFMSTDAHGEILISGIDDSRAVLHGEVPGNRSFKSIDHELPGQIRIKGQDRRLLSFKGQGASPGVVSDLLDIPRESIKSVVINNVELAPQYLNQKFRSTEKPISKSEHYSTGQSSTVMSLVQEMITAN